jgi:hypothetical protein
MTSAVSEGDFNGFDVLVCRTSRTKINRRAPILWIEPTNSWLVRSSLYVKSNESNIRI